MAADSVMPRRKAPQAICPLANSLLPPHALELLGGHFLLARPFYGHELSVVLVAFGPGRGTASSFVIDGEAVLLGVDGVSESPCDMIATLCWVGG